MQEIKIVYEKVSVWLWYMNVGVQMSMPMNAET